MDNGFWFDNLHSLGDMGVIAIRDKKRTVSAPGEVRSYTVGGMQGDLAFGDARELKTYTQTVRLYADRPLETDTAATAKWRELVAWLGVGRRPLVWDCEPDKQIMAEVVDYTGDPTGWVDEGLKVTLKCQPLMRSTIPTRRTIDVADGDVHVIQLRHRTMLPSPVDVDIRVQGAAPLTGCTIKMGSGTVGAIGMDVRPGETLRIGMELPAGAEIIHADGSAESAMRHLIAFGRLEAVCGDELRVSLIFSGVGSAQVTAETRGVWR